MRPGQTIRLLIALAVAAILLLQSCSPAKRALREQKALRELITDHQAHNAPAIDTATQIIPGTVDTVQVIAILTQSDTAALKKAKDSLKAAFAIRYASTAADCERQVNEAFETGKAYTLHQLSQQKKVQQQPATVIKKIYPTQFIAALQNQLAFTEGQLRECQNKNTWLWHFIFSVAANVLLLVLLISTAKKIK